MNVISNPIIYHQKEGDPDPDDHPAELLQNHQLTRSFHFQRKKMLLLGFKVALLASITSFTFGLRVEKTSQFPMLMPQVSGWPTSLLSVRTTEQQIWIILSRFAFPAWKCITEFMKWTVWLHRRGVNSLKTSGAPKYIFLDAIASPSSQCRRTFNSQHYSTAAEVKIVQCCVFTITAGRILDFWILRAPGRVKLTN